MVSSAVSRRGAPTSVRWRPEAVRHAARLRRSELLQLRSAIWGSQPDAVSDGFPNDEARRARKGLGGAARFGVVGASGLAVNEASIALFVSGLGLHYVVGYLLATQCSTLWNFTFVEFWAFRDAEVTNRRWHRYVLLVFVNNLANVLTAPLFVLLTSIVGINYLVSNILTLGIVFLGRFVFADRIWGGNNTRRRKQAVPAEIPATTQLDPSCCHAESLIAARAGSRRLAFPSARRRLYDALITEGDALEQFGFDTFSRYAVAPCLDSRRITSAAAVNFTAFAPDSTNSSARGPSSRTRSRRVARPPKAPTALTRGSHPRTTTTPVRTHPASPEGRSGFQSPSPAATQSR